MSKQKTDVSRSLEGLKSELETVKVASPPMLQAPSREAQPESGTKRDKNAKQGRAYTFRISDDIHERMKLLSWYRKATDKEIIETALREYFDRHLREIERARKASEERVI